MINNKWKQDTGECIKISKTGRILDGQHRLKAVILSNCSIYFYVATNIDDSVFDVLDTGKARNSRRELCNSGGNYRKYNSSNHCT
jgi:hypothetical protein